MTLFRRGKWHSKIRGRVKKKKWDWAFVYLCVFSLLFSLVQIEQGLDCHVFPCTSHSAGPLSIKSDNFFEYSDLYKDLSNSDCCFFWPWMCNVI